MCKKHLFAFGVLYAARKESMTWKKWNCQKQLSRGGCCSLFEWTVSEGGVSVAFLGRFLELDEALWKYLGLLPASQTEQVKLDRPPQINKGEAGWTWGEGTGRWCLLVVSNYTPQKANMEPKN